ncbi:MAG TPA: LCP family protein [Streptosporangiaceae bacterium]|nr:LCP family protein [Streptosporangiaceae bacterium]
MDDDSDPFERYFRPRRGGRSAGDDPARARDAGADGSAGAGDDVDGVAIDGERAPRVPVRHRRRHGAPGPGSSGSSGSDSGSVSAASAPVGQRTARDLRRKRRTLTVTAAISGIVLATSGVAWAFQGYVTDNIKKVDPFQGLEGRPDTGPKGAMNILIAGVDRRDGLSREQIHRLHLGRDDGARSDTMMLVHLSADHDKVTIVNLPRDSLVTIPAHRSNGSEGARGAHVPDRQGKLTWSYQFGGASLTVKTIERATGIRVDHYVEVNFLGFVKMVDALGGVTVCTEQAINDKKSGLKLPAGKHHLDGVKGLAFARARYSLTGGSDLPRIGRQQEFMAAMMQQALSTSTLADPVKSTKFLNASLKSVRVDPGLAKDVNALTRQLRGLTTDSVVFADVPLANSNYVASISGSPPQSTVLWDGRAAGALFRQIKKDQPVMKPAAPAPTATASAGGQRLTVPPGKITVRVLNGVGTPGLARKAARQLQAAGFETVVVPGTAKTTGRKTTIIQYGPGRADSAKTLAAALPGARLKRSSSIGNTVQVIVGSSWNGAKRVEVAGAGQPGRAAGAGGIQAKTATQKVCR